MSFIKYSWKVTELLDEDLDTWDVEDVEEAANYGVNDENFSLLADKFSGTLQRWRVADAEGHFVVEGWIVGEYEGNEVLNDWAASALNCTRMYLFTEDGDDGGPGWRQL